MPDNSTGPLRNPDCFPRDTPPALIGQEANMKLLFDAMLNDFTAGMRDDRADYRRRMNNASTFDHFVNMGFASAMLTATQTGETEDQQSVSPVRTATADALVGSEGVSADTVATSNAAIAASLGNLASALVPIITAAGGIVSAQTLAALLPVVISAAGTASNSATSTKAGA